MESWIVPCNIKVFNIIEYLKTHKTVVWKNSFSIHEGDNVYIYIGSPCSQIRYKCLVINDKVDEELLTQNEYARVQKPSNNFYSKKEKYIQMQLVDEYPDGFLEFEDLKKNGLGQVQIQARTTRRLQMYLNQKEAEWEVEKRCQI